MSAQQTITSEILAQIEEFVSSRIEDGTITAENYEDTNKSSQLLTEFIKESGCKIPRLKVRASWQKVINSHFSDAVKKVEKPSKPAKDEPSSDESDSDDTEKDESDESDNDKSDDDDNDDTEEEEEKPKPKPKAKKPKSSKRPAKDKKEAFAEKVAKTTESKKTKTRELKAEKTKEKVHIEFAYCRDLNIDNPKSQFNITDAKAPKDFPPSDVDLSEAEKSVITFFTGDEELAEAFTETKKKFIDDVAELRDTYKFDEKKAHKKQHFTITAKTVKYVDPTSDKLTMTDLPKNEQKIFREFGQEANEFGETFKAALKPTKPSKKEIDAMDKDERKQFKLNMKNQETTKALEFLTTPIIRTQNIIKIDFLLKNSEIKDENACKITNTIIEPISETDWTKMESDKKYKPFAPDYIQLFIDIKKFNGSNYGRLCKTIYNHRDTLIHHNKLNYDVKKNAWLQALGNIVALKRKLDEEDNLIFNCWENVLSSQYAFKIVMLGLPANDFFKKSFEILIQEPLSVQLFESALYPISFVFTPNMLGYTGFELPTNCFGKTETTYKKNLQLALESFGSAASTHYSYSECSWIYYLGKVGQVKNDMIALLRKAVKMTTHETSDESDPDDEEKSE